MTLGWHDFEAPCEKGIESFSEKETELGVQADRITIPKITTEEASILLLRKPAMQERIISLFLSR